MGSFSKIIIVSALLLMVSACATTPTKLPEKYMLDNQLERVGEIADIMSGRPKPSFTDFIESFEDAQTVIKRRDTVTLNETNFEWIKIDDQSFAIRSIQDQYHLLVLNRPSPFLMTTDIISFQLLARSLKARTDYIDLGGERYLIERIYKITSTDQLQNIKNQILTQP